MAKRAIPYQDGMAGEVFVRMLATGTLSVSWGEEPVAQVHSVLGRHQTGTRLSGRVPVSDIVAVVVDDAKFDLAQEPPAVAFASTRRGTSATFATPEDAARYLEGLGWRVEPPPPPLDKLAVARVMLTDAEGGFMHMVSDPNPPTWVDAHAEPIGEPRYIVTVRDLPRYANGGLSRSWWVSDTEDLVRPRCAGPFTHHHLAQSAADELNAGEAR